MSPSYNHAYLQAKLSGLLQHEKYSVLSAFTLDINGKDYIPDICVYPKKTITWFHDIIKSSEMPLTAIEIVSPTQTIQEILDKFRIYFKAGIKSCWLIEPVTNTVIIFYSDENGERFVTGEVTDKILDLKITKDQIFY